MAVPLVVRFERVLPVVPLLVVPLVPVAMQAVVERQAQGSPVPLEAVPLAVPAAVFPESGDPLEREGLPIQGTPQPRPQ